MDAARILRDWQRHKAKQALQREQARPPADESAAKPARKPIEPESHIIKRKGRWKEMP